MGMSRFSTYTPGKHPLKMLQFFVITLVLSIVAAESPPEIPMPTITLPEFEGCLSKKRLELLPGGGGKVCEKCCKPPKQICIQPRCQPGATSCVGRKRRDAEDRMCYIKPEECGEETCTPLQIRPQVLPPSRPAPGPKLVGEGETCNESLPPQHRTICGEGLYCKTPLMTGASGVCTSSGNDCTKDCFKTTVCKAKDCGVGGKMHKTCMKKCQKKGKRKSKGKGKKNNQN